VLKAVLADYRNAPIDPKLRATLALLEKVTLTPAEVVADDARAVLATGVTAQGVRDALFVGAMFNLINRLGDAFGFAVPDDAAFESGAKALLRFGYKL
jgi:alkylhydroperoxidase family enzyme